ncbi:hypothetical protein [Heliomarina baculiformis]|uniref:hypothetical protein n=1 Tax=Heliomarina baculiformis TaxID=2872036 RepID=UPI001EE1B785|nr:hypothetical protein [Heliomarina baculiformis]
MEKNDQFRPVNGARTNSQEKIDLNFCKALACDFGLDDEMNAEFFHALWAVAMNLIDLEFGSHPIQKASDQRLWTRTSRCRLPNHL